MLVEGVFGDGRKNAVCGSPVRRRAHGRTVQEVWNLLPYVLTCVVEPPEQVLPAARGREGKI
jgi:hypothetical protein